MELVNTYTGTMSTQTIQFSSEEELESDDAAIDAAAVAELVDAMVDEKLAAYVATKNINRACEHIIHVHYHTRMNTSVQKIISRMNTS